MHRGQTSMAAALIMLLLLSCTSLASPAPSAASAVDARSDDCPLRPPGNPIDLVYAWLEQQQDPVTGLLSGQQDTFSRNYVNALAVMAFSLRGDYPRAKKILDYYWGRASEYYDGQCSAFGPGCVPPACGPTVPCGFFQDRDSESGEPYETGDRWMGDNAWLLMAIHHYQAQSDDTTYAPMGRAIAGLLRSLQQPAGHIATGWTQGDSKFKASGHAEGNLDAYKALALAGEAIAAGMVKAWLDTCNPEKDECRSINWKNSSFDLHIWRVLSLGREYGHSLLDIERTDDRCIRYVNTIQLCNQAVTGFVEAPVCLFSENCGMEDNIWAEGTGGAAVAFYKAGYKLRGDSTARELDKLLIEPEDYPGTLAMPYLARPAPNCPGLEWADPEKGQVAATAWYIFARARYDPFDGETLDILPPAQPVAQLEAEVADAYGSRNEDVPQCYRLESTADLGIASGGRVAHMTDGLRTDDSCWADYRVNLLYPLRDATIRLRYADDVAGDVCRIWWDGVKLGAFTTASTGGWWQFSLSDPVSMGSLQGGLHTLRIEVEDRQTYGVAIDFAAINGQAQPSLQYLPLSSR